jgi:molybdopterin-binding protein
VLRSPERRERRENPESLESPERTHNGRSRMPGGTRLPPTWPRSPGVLAVRANVASMRLSARNQLPGTVRSVDRGAVMANVVIQLKGGQEVVAAITKDAVDQLGLAEGDAVTAVIKATEVMVGKA